MKPLPRVHPQLGSPIPTSPRSAEALLRSVLNTLEPVVLRLDADFRVRFISRIAPEYRLEEVLGAPATNFIEARNVPKARASWEAALRGEMGYYRSENTAAPGVRRTYETWVGPYDGPEGRGVLLVGVEVTPYFERERTLLEAEASLEMAQEATGMGLWSWDRRTGNVHWNSRMLELCGQTTALHLGQYLERLVHPEDRQTLRTVLPQLRQQTRFSTPPYRIVLPDGSIRRLRSSGTVLHDEYGELTAVVGGTLDVTAEFEQEELNRQRQRLESIGQLTAGIAHNFNNLLATIIPTLELLSPSAPPRLQPLAEDALRSSLRAADILQQLGQYARQETSDEPNVTETSEPVGRTVRLCQRLFKPAIELSLALDESPLHVGVGEAELEQALVNLLLNARDALEDTPLPRIRVEVTRQTPPPELAWHPQEPTATAVTEATAVVVRVADNGPGMPEDVRSRVFEPFFTTKEAGRGTGLGLAMVEATVRRAGGVVRCLSRPQEGACFELWLPLLPPQEVTRRLEPSLPRPGRGEQVLVVDDEPGILHSTSLVLESAGYRASCAASCQEALAQVDTHPDIEAVLLDRWLADGNGTELIEALRDRLPGVVVLLHTGNGVSTHERHRTDGVLEKPVSPQVLLERLGQALETAHAELGTE